MRLSRERAEALLGDLTDAAYPVLVRHGVRGSSVELEVEVGQAVEEALTRRQDGPAPHCLAWPDLLAEVTRAAYEVALRRGFPRPFPDLELGLWRAVRRAVA
jgi:hypothetical protein